MTKNCHNDYKMKFPMDEEYPDLSLHNNHMSKVLTKDIYTKLRGKSTPSGFTLDDCIQTGVDNPGKMAFTNTQSILNRSIHLRTFLLHYHHNKLGYHNSKHVDILDQMCLNSISIPIELFFLSCLQVIHLS